MNDIRLGTFQILDKNVLNNDLSFGNNTEVILINFNLDTSIKIIPFFEKIEKNEKKSLPFSLLLKVKAGNLSF